MNAAQPEIGRDAAIALIEWYRDAGIDVFVGEAPRDRFAETRAEIAARDGRRGVPSAPAAQASAPPVHAPAPTFAIEPAGTFATSRAAVPDDIAIADARERARSAATLAELQAALDAFESCNLRITAKSTVFGDGAETADVMFVGEAPGREEDIAGVPFVGRSGQLLDRMLAAIGLERQNVRVTNTVPWRPPGNRPPTPAETQICLPFVQRHIELVRPKILVCLGSPAAKAILASEEGILRIRGRWTTYSFGLGEADTIDATAMLHPAYLLRQPAQKKLAWRDLVALKARLAEKSASD
ncbi:MAG: uracil-DNA glycosylase [Aurantimonas endophytica]|uniref:Type-4 uracil-DNA glycosylase n=1 Tax=Aurantimonas endophytica TaxID=1522175 RepID=A0A7W6MQS1_9HYPH|nr:uracil-DNA glycosylase [Aurantimonas endophytica]MBB4004248.1 DNA polymerase [Aurantimonas endophytica]MCO6405089.1 uracil-DNA glycosylase [Aurantimonas endophytica]